MGTLAGALERSGLRQCAIATSATEGSFPHLRAPQRHGEDPNPDVARLALAVAASTSGRPAGASTPPPSTERRRSTYHLSRRACNAGVLGLALSAACPSPAEASKLGPLADKAWEAVGGGPGDLYFPAEFLGTWAVTSTLVKLEAPLGEDVIPDPAAYKRAAAADLDRPLQYNVQYMHNSTGKVIYNRKYNIAQLVGSYNSGLDLSSRITWDPEDPNVLRVSLPQGTGIRTRVTRRSQVAPAADRLETSEYLEQVFDVGGSGSTRLKASQCFTKFKWRPEEDARKSGGPVIIATQVVSDYLTAYDGEEQYLRAMGKPYAVYTYRMSFSRPQ